MDGDDNSAKKVASKILEEDLKNLGSEMRMLSDLSRSKNPVSNSDIKKRLEEARQGKE